MKNELEEIGGIPMDDSPPSDEMKKEFEILDAKPVVPDKKKHPELHQEAIKFALNMFGNAPVKAAAGFAQTVGNIPTELANTGINIANKLSDSNIPNLEKNQFAPQGLAADIGKVGGEIYGLGAGRHALDAVSKIPGIAKMISQHLPNNAIARALTGETGKNVLSMGLTGAAINPENPMVGGAEGIANAVLPGIPKAFNALKPSNLFRGSQTPQELEHVLKATEGTETPLGDVLKNPFLKNTYENVLSKIPGSGVNTSLEKTGKQIVEKGDKIVTDLLGKHNPQNVEGELNQALTKTYEQHRANKTAIYDKANKLADEIKLPLSLPTFSKSAKQFAAAIKDTNILKTEPEFKSLMQKLGNYKKPTKEIKSSIVGVNGQPLVSKIKYPSLKEANILSGKLSELAEKYESSPNIADRNASGVFKRLAKSLKTDIHSSINQSGNKDLKKVFNVAEENYAKNFSPFLDKDIFKFANGKVDPDMIVQHFIKTGKSTDRANLLGKFIDKLPPDKRELLGYAYLKRAMNSEGKIDPHALRQLISRKSLGERQFNLLFPGKLGKELKDYELLVSRNPEAFQVMKNPKTGARLTDYLPYGLGAAGMAFGGPAGAVIGALGVPAAARYASKKLASPEYRNKLLRKMIDKEKPKNKLKQSQGWLD